MNTAWWNRRSVLMKPDDGDEGGGGDGGAPSPSPSPSPPAAPTPPAPSPGPAAPAPPAPSPGAGAPAAPAPGPAAPTPPAKTAEGYWPADWRETVSKEDAKTLARLQRYASPEAAMSALIAAQNRIAAGELKPVLGKNPSAEQLAEYRAAMGIPDTPDKYDLGKEVKIADTEKPLVEKLFAAAHATNQTPDQVAATMKVYRELEADVKAKEAERDDQQMVEGTDALRVEWGTEFRRNVNLISGLLDGAGSQGLKDQVLNARLPDGRKFGNSPEVMKMLVGLALVQNPTGVVVPGGGGDPSAGIKEELGAIAKARSTDRAAYNKNTKMQERERELLTAATKMGLMDDQGNWKKA